MSPVYLTIFIGDSAKQPVSLTVYPPVFVLAGTVTQKAGGAKRRVVSAGGFTTDHPDHGC